jgi:hypothetical protein
MSRSYTEDSLIAFRRTLLVHEMLVRFAKTFAGDLQRNTTRAVREEDRVAIEKECDVESPVTGKEIGRCPFNRFRSFDIPRERCPDLVWPRSVVEAIISSDHPFRYACIARDEIAEWLG